MTTGLDALTEKEKQTLRLIVRGYDAKSAARRLDLSVHTINGRLRDARRKMAVPSSREAARLLLEAEGPTDAAPDPDSLADKEIGAVPGGASVNAGDAPIGGAPAGPRRAAILIGACIMTIALALLAITALPQTAPVLAPAPADTSQSADSEAVAAARHFLQLVDQRRWADSYAATGATFHRQNSLRAWTAASEKGRAPLGPATSRDLVSAEDVPAPPNGYQLVKFRTRYATGGDPTIETVTLDRENRVWRVTGVMLN